MYSRGWTLIREKYRQNIEGFSEKYSDSWHFEQLKEEENREEKDAILSKSRGDVKAQSKPPFVSHPLERELSNTTKQSRDDNETLGKDRK